MPGVEGDFVKKLYVRLARALRAVLAATGLLGLLDRWAARSRTGAWIRSLLGIYDAADLVQLDTPWWTYAAADIVDARLAARPGARVFEWGSGASTVWLARRAARVTAVEHDVEWAELVRGMVPENATVRVVRPETPAVPVVTSSRAGCEGMDFSRYVAAIEGEGPFDLIVIDGRAREACLVPALEHLHPDGVIVFDNVDRVRYRNAIAAVADRVDVRWTRGRTPGLPYPTRTALLRHRH